MSIGTYPAAYEFMTAIFHHWGGFMASGVIIGILITFLIIVLVLYLVQRLPIDGRMRQIVQIIVIIIGIVSLLKYLAVF
jgi:hypothetical protein